MAYEIPGFKLTLVAGEDLSSDQYKFVKLDANGNVVKCTAVTDKPVGILQNNPPNGGEAELMLDGVSKLVAGAAIAIDAVIVTDANSKAAAGVPGTDTTKYAVGRALESTANANEFLTVQFSTLNIHRAA